VAFGSAVGLFMMAMFLATAVPAARASRLDPVENLRIPERPELFVLGMNPRLVSAARSCKMG